MLMYKHTRRANSNEKRVAPLSLSLIVISAASAIRKSTRNVANPIPIIRLYRYFHNQLEARLIDEIGDLGDLWDNKTILNWLFYFKPMVPP